MTKKLMRKKLALMLANLKKKRKYYCEVEYLETTNQQTDSGSTNEAAYIDTGIIPNNNTRIECRMQFTTLISGQSKEALNGTNGSESAPRFAWGFASISPYTNFYFGLGAQNLTTSVTRDTNVHTFVLDAKNKTCSIDDTTQSFTSSGSIDSTRSIYLFARHATSAYANKPCNARIYRYRNWNNDQLVQDLIPVLDWDMTPCMYDKVSGQLFYNQGTGDFTAGREIHPVEYLESTGTQYINTGYAANANTIVEYNFNLVEVPTSSAFFGSGTSDTSTNRFQGYYESSLSFSTKLASTTTYSGVTFTAGTKHYSKMGIPLAGYYIDDTFIASATGTPASLNLYIFARNINGSMQSPIKMKLYDFKISENNSLVRDFIPAIDENGVGFMFDRVSHTIYDNAGTGAFSYPARELEYLQSSGTQYIDIGLKGKNGYDFEYKVNFTQVGTTAYAVGGLYESQKSCYMGMIRTNSKLSYHYQDTSSPIEVQTVSANTDYTVKAHMYSGEQYFEVNGVRSSSGTKSGDFKSTNNMWLFGLNSSSPLYSYLKMPYCKIKYNNTLVRDFIPCYKDGVACMVDKLTGTAYLNQGTGTFTTGKIVEPEYE